ncbi:putative toxin-antitoxin system toxin component, PIN family [Rhodoferax sp.]|uniref:putative toxin-antitoxin system toxin component, PIN family n=1 Tax=Rhodoferax sp. TaxID=50421 RepID=UPI00374CE775
MPANKPLELGPGPHTVVLDTNIVLDVFIFDDKASKPLQPALASGQLRWLATQHMRNELERVLDYTHLVPRLAFYQITKADVLAQFDRFANLVEVAPRISSICKDPDDQCFIDLAVAHQALLLSKDKAVLSMKKRLLAQGVSTHTAILFV